MIEVMVSIASYQRRRPEQGMGPLRHGLLSRPIQLRDVNFDGCGGWVQKYFAPGGGTTILPRWCQLAHQLRRQ